MEKIMKQIKNKDDYSIIIDFSIRKLGHDVIIKKLKETIKKKIAIHPIDSVKIQGSIGVDYKSEDEAIKVAKFIKRKFIFVSKVKVIRFFNGNEVPL